MTSRSASQSATHHATLVRSLSQSAQSAAELSHATVKLARHGIGPIHARATANARRLRGR